MTYEGLRPLTLGDLRDLEEQIGEEKGGLKSSYRDDKPQSG